MEESDKTTTVQHEPATHLVFGLVQRSVFDPQVGCFLSTSVSGVDSSVYKQTSIRAVDVVGVLRPLILGLATASC